MPIKHYISTVSTTLLTVFTLTCCLQPVYATDEAPAPATGAASEQAHRLVIQVNSDSMDEQDHVLSNVVNLQKHYGLDDIEIEIVAYGPGIWLVTDKSNFASRVESLMMQNVVFTACGNTMDAVEAKSGARPTLLDGVETTKAGIARIMELQEQGWSYLSP